MVQKKARKERRMPSPTNSPLVSDDDGIDLNFVPQPNVEAPSAEPLPHQPHVPSAGEESDSSSDGDENPVGDIPMRWYEGYDHIGYDRSGQKILPHNRPSALELAADKSAWRRIYDEKNDKEIVLTHEELKQIARLRAGRYPRGEGEEDEVIPWSGDVVQHPLTSGTEPKRRFLPSRHEARLVMKLVRGMRAGLVKRPSQRKKEQEEEEEEDMYQYDAWKNFEPKTRDEMTKSERARDIMRVAAPKVALPMHAESYNPPEEYLPNEEEEKEWNDLDPEDRERNYLPSKNDALRLVPGYDNFIRERFERCLDLYLAVRVVKDQRKVDPEDLIPDLPSPKELRPFPTDIVSTFGPLPSRARSIDVHPSGQWLLTGSDDAKVRLWDVTTGYCQNTWDLSSLVPKIDDSIPPISCVAWNPKLQCHVFAVSIGYVIIVIGAASAMGIATEETDIAMEGSQSTNVTEKTIKAMEDAGILWEQRNFSAEDENGVDVNTGAENGAPNAESRLEDRSPMILITHPKPLRSLCWHHKGDYLASVGKDSGGGTVAIHRLSYRSTQMPFKKKTALVQAVKFHPKRPFFMVATMHHVRIYNLALQQMVKTLKPGVSWISAIDVHPSGDHVLVSSYDKRLCWFDLDFSVRPYKTIRNHDKAVRTAKYHPRLPLFADASDDGSSHVFHGMVYDDLAKNALIVPLKKLENCTKIVQSLGVLDIAWHPRLPWLFTSGADGSIHVIVDCSQG